MNQNIKKIFILITLILIVICLHASFISAAEITADAVAEKNEVFKGESFIFQIQISGSENPLKPDVSSINDFNVESLGGQQNSNRSVTIINGRVKENVRKGYLFNYRLTPHKTGYLTIPSIIVHADNQTIKTSSVRIKSNQPVETSDFKIRLSLSGKNCYTGESIILKTTFYFSQSIQELTFSFPALLQNDVFYFADLPVNTQDGGKYHEIVLNDKEIIGKRGNASLDGHQFQTITFSKILIPKEAGQFDIQQALATCVVLVGYKKRSSGRNSFFQDDVFSDFFDDAFFSGRRGEYKKFVIPSNHLKLNVSSVPETGKPPDFSGHIGEFEIYATAKPAEVSVGDPITLQIGLSGPDYLEHIKFPSLKNQEQLKKDFKIPKEMAEGEIIGKTKFFTQTVRALRSDVTVIPPILLPYFDTKSGTYKIAKTGQIPLKVKSAHVVTAEDAEGSEVVLTAKKDIETWTKGISHNYGGNTVIKNQLSGLVSVKKSPLLLAFLTVSPFIYLFLLMIVSYKGKQQSDPLKVRYKKAFFNFKKTLKESNAKNIEDQKRDVLIMKAIRNYLGSKLKIPGGSITFKDVEQILKSGNVNSETLNNLKSLFNQLEAGRYAGHVEINDYKKLMELALNTIKTLEKKLT